MSGNLKRRQGKKKWLGQGKVQEMVMVREKKRSRIGGDKIKDKIMEVKLSQR